MASTLFFWVRAYPGQRKIPTGWEITLDLIRKLAKLYGETCDPDPEHWYLNKFGKEADYSNLLDELAKKPTERQQLLRGCIGNQATGRTRRARNSLRPSAPRYRRTGRTRIPKSHPYHEF